jgi:2-haloacid dehalogenase
MSAIDPRHVEVLTFDCYGTLIDWESGLLAALRAVLSGHGVEAGDDDLLEAYARHETAAERGAYRPYREVLRRALRGLCRERGLTPSEEETEAFAGSVADWPPFPDSAPALSRLSSRYRLGVITNCDDDLFAGSNRKLGVTFDWVVTAEQVGAYKPDERPFHAAFERLGLPRDRILHVAQSLYHDHATAKRLGLTTVWIDRRGGREGSGATPVAQATPDATFPDMASFAAAVA